MKNRKNGLSGVGQIGLENGKDFLRPLPTPVWGLKPSPALPGMPKIWVACPVANPSKKKSLTPCTSTSIS